MAKCVDHAGERLRNKIECGNSWVYLYITSFIVDSGYCLVCGKVKFYFLQFFFSPSKCF